MAVKALEVLLLVGAGAYLALLIYGVFLSESAMFQPHPASYRDGVEIIKLTSRDGARISAAYLPNADARYTLLFCHGNAEDLGDDLPLLAELRRAGFAVFIFDYQGYGTSQGRPTEQHTYDDADAAYDYLTGPLKVPANRIIAVGRSLGSAVCVDLATRRPVAGLILQSAFTSAFRVVTQVPILPFDKYRSLAKIRNIHVPVLVIHGTADEVVPFSHGEKLFAASNQPKRSLWVQGGDHNSLTMHAGARYFTTLQAFARLVEAEQK